MYERPIDLLLLTRKDIVDKLTKETHEKLESLIRYDDNLIVELAGRAGEAEKYVAQYKKDFPALQEKYDKLNRDYKLRVKALDENISKLNEANKKIEELNRTVAQLQQKLTQRR